MIKYEELIEYISPTAFQFVDKIYDYFLDDPYEARDILENMPPQELAEAAIATSWIARTMKTPPAYVKNICMLLKMQDIELTEENIQTLIDAFSKKKKILEDIFTEGIMLSITKAIQEMF